MDLWANGAAVKARPGMEQLPEPKAELAAQMASEFLAAATGDRYGIVTRTVRPTGCGHTCDPGPPSERAVVGWGMAMPLARVVGPWPLPGPYGGMAAQCRSCACWSSTGVVLSDRRVLWDGDHPIVVTVDGAPLASDGTAWQLVDDDTRGTVLVRIDGQGLPRCQDLTKPLTASGTWSVVYSRGEAPPVLGVQAAISLAVEYAKLNKWIAGDCQLPTRVRTITRERTTMAVLDPQTVIKEGGTGLVDVDMFIKRANPAGLRRAATVTSPGSGRHQATVRTAPA